jgi:hypothetical protein
MPSRFRAPHGKCGRGHDVQAPNGALLGDRLFGSLIVDSSHGDHLVSIRAEIF